ncbi:MAG TPA: glycosyltransferase 61 family protein [Tabrizicola sp.]|nr:glycosyltransferase 61 family protein [Tabrizicola sp.]
MSEVQTFRDVPVMPLQAFREHDPQGGPIWPDFESQTTARFCRQHGVPVDLLPTPEPCTEEITEDAIWGGYLHPHFGHLVAEHLTRILPGLQARPDDLILFMTEKDRDPATVPSHFHDVLHWYGVSRDRVRIISQPTLVRKLSVVPQGEVLWGKAPDPSYLDLLDALPDRHGITPVKGDIVYVSRTGLASMGQGSHLGEGYLVHLLERLGVTIFDPVGLSIREQMERYAGARTLIFAEGSALHGRQLLGRVRQDVHVLMRRVRYLARPLLRPRVRRLMYLNTHGGVLQMRDRANKGFPHLNAVFYQTEALLAGFERMGLNLRPHWDQNAYLAAALSDAADWEKAKREDKVLSDRNLRVYLSEMSATIKGIRSLPGSFSAG